MSDAWPVASGMRTGVIDIGSNSIRLVVFDGLNRAPLPIINHKAVIGLGVDVERLGHLGVEAFRSGIETVDALVRIAQSVPVADLALYATAAVRDAANGSDFCRSIETRTGYAVKVLSGDEEARLSALGVISAVPELTGVVGDLGGGSLELVAVRRGIIMERSTLGIGPLRMMERWGADPGDSESQIAEAFDKVAWLADWKYHCFHAVGGSWRAIARLPHGTARLPAEDRPRLQHDEKRDARFRQDAGKPEPRDDFTDSRDLEAARLDPALGCQGARAPAARPQAFGRHLFGPWPARGTPLRHARPGDTGRRSAARRMPRAGRQAPPVSGLFGGTGTMAAARLLTLQPCRRTPGACRLHPGGHGLEGTPGIPRPSVALPGTAHALVGARPQPAGLACPCPVRPLRRILERERGLAVPPAARTGKRRGGKNSRP